MPNFPKANNVPKKAASGPAPKRDSSGKPKPRETVVKKANAARKSQQGSKMFGAVGGYGGVNKKDVKKLVNGQVRDAIRPIRNDMGTIRKQAGDAVQDTNTLYDRSVGDLNHIFGEAGSYIDHMGQQINAGYQQTGAAMQGISQQAVGGMQANNTAAQQAVMSELQRLGLDNGMGVDAGLVGDGAFSVNQAIQGGANAQASNAASQQAANTVSGLLGGMIAGSKSSSLGQALNTRNADIADIGRTKRDDLSTVLDSIQELKKSRPTAIREMLLQLQAQGFDQWQAIQALNMDRRAMNHSMSMDRAGMAEDGSYYSTLATAYGAQAGQPGSTVPGATNGSPRNPGAGYTNGTAPVVKGPKKSKPRAGSGSRNSEIPGPLAGGYS